MQQKSIIAISIVIFVMLASIAFVFVDMSKSNRDVSKIKDGELIIEEKLFKKIGTYKDRFGIIQVLSFGEDTIYVAEGRSSSYPISIQVK